MSDQSARIDQIERQMLIDRNATNILLNRTDQIQSDFRTLQTTINQQFANMQQDLHLLIEMFRTQQTQLAEVRQEVDGVRQEMKSRFDQVDQRFEATNQRTAGVRQEVAEVRQEMKGLNTRFDRLEALIIDRLPPSS